MTLAIDDHRFAGHVFVHLQYGLSLHDTSVIDKDINLSEMLDTLLSYVSNTLSIGDVQGLCIDHGRRPLLLPDHVNCFAQSLLVDVTYRDFGAQSYKFKRHDSSETRSGSRDENMLVFDRLFG